MPCRATVVYMCFLYGAPSGVVEPCWGTWCWVVIVQGMLMHCLIACAVPFKFASRSMLDSEICGPLKLGTFVLWRPENVYVTKFRILFWATLCRCVQTQVYRQALFFFLHCSELLTQHLGCSLQPSMGACFFFHVFDLPLLLKISLICSYSSSVFLLDGESKFDEKK